jgi:hypothetical protein
LLRKIGCLATVARDISPKIRTALPLPTIHLSCKYEVNWSKTLGGVEWQRFARKKEERKKKEEERISINSMYLARIAKYNKEEEY